MIEEEKEIKEFTLKLKSFKQEFQFLEKEELDTQKLKEIKRMLKSIELELNKKQREFD